MLTLSESSVAAPSFDEPLEMLHACHDKVRHFCLQLERLQTCLAQPVADDEIVRRAIDGVVRYFDTAGPQHHADEELELFPLLLAHDPSCAPHLELLRDEHAQLTGHWQRVRTALLALRHGDENAASLWSGCDVASFVRRYREHAAFEETWLFPAAARWLDAEARYNAGRRMAARRRVPTESR